MSLFSKSSLPVDQQLEELVGQFTESAKKAEALVEECTKQVAAKEDQIKTLNEEIGGLNTTKTKASAFALNLSKLFSTDENS